MRNKLPTQIESLACFLFVLLLTMSVGEAFEKPSDQTVVSAVVTVATEKEAKSFAQFQDSAKAWRALPAKPALLEEVQRFRVLAENAFKKKDFAEAIGYYEQGLAVEPLWPDGQFNAALVAAELQYYGRAVHHMKRFLELCPDAKDANTCRQQMWVWQEEAKKLQASALSAAQPNVKMRKENPGMYRSLSEAEARVSILGAEVESVTPELAKKLNLPVQNGALIREVWPSCPADTANLKAGDIIIEFDGKKVVDGPQLSLLIRQTTPDTWRVIKFIRDGQSKTVKVPLAGLPTSVIKAVM
jgi:S1-C subfamily serine protease